MNKEYVLKEWRRIQTSYSNSSVTNKLTTPWLNRNRQTNNNTLNQRLSKTNSIKKTALQKGKLTLKGNFTVTILNLTHGDLSGVNTKF